MLSLLELRRPVFCSDKFAELNTYLNRKGQHNGENKKILSLVHWFKTIAASANFGLSHKKIKRNTKPVNSHSKLKIHFIIFFNYPVALKKGQGHQIGMRAYRLIKLIIMYNFKVLFVTAPVPLKLGKGHSVILNL